MKPRELLDTLFRPYSETRRNKPRDMTYIAQEKPDTYTALTAGMTHALLVLMLVIYTVIIGTEIGLSSAELSGFVSIQIVVMGLTTVLQSMTTRFSAGHLLIHGPSIIAMTSFIAAASQFGLGAASGGLIVSAVVIIALARFLPRMQTFFPPEVAGVLLVLLGLSLVEGGIKRFTGLDEGHIDPVALGSAVPTLFMIIAVSIWAGKRLQIFAVAIGMASGLLAAVAMGSFGSEQLSRVANQPIFAFPFGEFVPPTPTFVLAAALPMLLIQIIVALNSFGTGVAIDRLNDAKWRRADLPMISRLISCHGISLFMNGATGTPPVGVASVNLGLVAVTGVAARQVATVAGAVLVVMAFFPQISSFIIQIPQPVVGAIIVYTAGYMMVVGMELVLSRMLNSRRIFMVGLSITVGASLLLMPELGTGVPPEFKAILTSPLAMGGLFAIVLNLVFRIGISEQAEIELSGPHAAQEATGFLEECGADWGARADVISRAAAAVGEALEAIHSNEMEIGPVTLKASFDEFKVVLLLQYKGKAFSLEPRKKLDLSALLDEDGDEALEDAMSSMSSHLIRNLADHVTSSDSGRFAELRMQFSH